MCAIDATIFPTDITAFETTSFETNNSAVKTA
jgi:hypothetical protein